NVYIDCFIYETIGYEKSFILATITYFLLRTGKCVVFLPDYRELANNLEISLSLPYYSPTLIVINLCQSSSVNNKTALHLMRKQTNEKKITLYRGFDEEEMTQWWKKMIPICHQ
ncbi:16983_t:CDS:2, partial [Funneliformis caledonium]